MELFDTHCHIHFPDYALDPDEVIQNAKNDDVTNLLCVGCTLTDSKLAIKMAEKHDTIWATIGLHPHEGKEYLDDQIALSQFRELAKQPQVVAIGETGLDYFYLHSDKVSQQKLFRFQLEIALEHDLPLVFHVRDAFEDFFTVMDEYKNVRGVVHSFSATTTELDKVLARGLYVGLNGIMTFTKSDEQLAAARAVPLDKLLLETDAPFLTPAPFRGTICEPKHVRVTAEFLANLRNESLEQLAMATTQNARTLLGIPL